MRNLCSAIVACATLLVGGCPPENYPTQSSVVQLDVEQIVNNNNLLPQEARDQLAALGFSPETINGLLADRDLANQFGGTGRTAYDKVVGGQLDQLTPDEIQIYASLATEANAGVNLQLDDAAAQAMADLLQENNLQTSDELAAFLDEPENVVPPTIPDGALRDLFVDFDPDLILSLLP